MNPSAQFKALGDPTRLKIFLSILERKHCVRSLSIKLGISESAVSQHMKTLREAGLVYGDRFGHHIHYLPSQEALDSLVDYCTSLKESSLQLNRDTTTCNCAYGLKVRS